MSKWITRLLDNSLWLAALGLMISSSGIDGAYLVRMMEPRLWMLGYVLNTVSDVAGLTLMYWFGRLRAEPKKSKKHKYALALVPAEVVAVAYSWFFSWLQLRIVLRSIEGVDAQWIAPIAAGFIPLTLTSIGWAQAVRDGRFGERKETQPAEDAWEPAPPTPEPAEDTEARAYRVCNPCSFTAHSPQAWAGHCRGAEHKRNASGVLAEGKEENGN